MIECDCSVIDHPSLLQLVANTLVNSKTNGIVNIVLSIWPYRFTRGLFDQLEKPSVIDLN